MAPFPPPFASLFPFLARTKATVEEEWKFKQFPRTLFIPTLSPFPSLAITKGPTNVQISSTNSTSLTVTWDLPPQNAVHGKIRQYSIRYCKVNCSSASANLTAWNIKAVDGAVRYTFLTQLTKWSCYSVQINAVTIKSGKWSTEVHNRTSEDGKKSHIILFRL